MRETSYRRALRARWFVVVATGLLITCLAVLAPPAPVSYPDMSSRLEDLADPAQAKYQATSVIGVPPLVSGGDATLQFKTIQFYVQSTGVGEAFATRLGYTGSDYAMLGRLIVITSDEKAGTMEVKGYGGTRTQAADITNAFTESLRDYLSGLGTQATQQSLEQSQASVDSLKQRIDELGAQIDALRAGGITAEQAVNDPQVIQLQAQRDALVQSYTAAYQQLAGISAGGTRLSTAGLAQLQPARAVTAEEFGPGLLYELWLRIVVGVIVGLALGAALALLLEHNARKIFSREAAERAFGARVLVEIPRQQRTGTPRDVAVITAPGSRVASAYRMLRVILLSEHATAGDESAERLPRHTRPAMVAVPARALLDTAASPVTAAVPAGPGSAAPSGNGSVAGPSELSASSSPGDVQVPVDPHRLSLVIAATANEPSHAAVVANLAASFVVGGGPVTVLRIGPSARRGSAPAADDDVVPDGAPPTKETSVTGVRLVEWQPVYGGPSAADVLENMQAGGGVVLVDAGRVATAEFAEMAPLIDGVVVACQIGRTTIANAERTADIIAWSHARLFGVVLTQVPATPVERATWSRWRRSPLTSGWGLRPSASRGRASGPDAEDDGRSDDELGLLSNDGTQR